ncbi:MAG: type II secretion system GspH family protein [Candidatus Peregrinibacteria bacterium]|nr:type II secretion system GspH family protein [Candidatus Peregrinibacteria bacterium]
MKTSFYKTSRTKGFTLIELLLYVSISGAIVFSLSTLLMTFLQARIKNQTISEIGEQGVYVMQEITNTIRNANGITSPTPGNTSSALVLTGATNTTFDLAGGAVRSTQGSTANLTSSRIIASNLVFQNVSRIGTTGIIRVQFTLTHLNPEGRNEYEFSRTFLGTAGILNP